MCLVALWFWLPLIAGFFLPQGEESPVAATPTPTTLQTTQQTQQQAVASPQPYPFSWHQLEVWKEQTPLSRAVLLTQIEQNPFQSLQFVTPVETDSKGKTSPKAIRKAPEIHPKDLGITLSSTLVGGQKKLAIVNGNILRVGSVLKRQNEDNPGDIIQFTLIEITKNYIVLQRKKQKFQLNLPGAKLQGNDQFNRVAPKIN